MKRNLKSNWPVVMVVLLALISCGERGEHAAHPENYTCPMHPTVLSDRPGTCPVCGMDLVRKGNAAEDVEISKDVSRLTMSPNEVVVSNVGTVKGEYKSLPIHLAAQGVVSYDTKNLYTISARTGGRLERIYLKYAFQQVSKGQKVAEIYSPEIATAQRELLFLMSNDSDNHALIAAAKKKLALLGLSPTQVGDLVKRGHASSTIGIYSPYAGYLITGQDVIPATSNATNSTAGKSMREGMAPTPSSAGRQASSGSLIREGEYITAGQTLFTIVNNDALRIELDLPASYSGSISPDDKVELSFGGDHIQSATVDLVQPYFNEGQEFLKVRVHTHDTGGLHIGHLVNAEIDLNPTEGLWVPRASVVLLGIHHVVFIKDQGAFKPKRVDVGITAAGMVEIKKGLASSDEIAANAQFLVDSESFIKTVE